MSLGASGHEWPRHFLGGLEDDFVDFGQFSLGELPAGGSGVHLGLFGCARSSDYGGYGVLRGKPGDGQFQQRMSVQRGKAEQRFDYIEITVGENGGAEGVFTAAVFGEGLAFAVFACEEPVGERKVGDERDARLFAFR